MSGSCNFCGNQHCICSMLKGNDIISDLCNALCGVLEQSYSCMSEEDKNEYRTTYNADALAVDLLARHGYVEITDGRWPQTKYLTFKFTDRKLRDRENVRNGF